MAAPVGYHVACGASWSFSRQLTPNSLILSQLASSLDCEVIVLLAEEPSRAFGFKLRADPNEPTHREMFDLLRSAFIAQRAVHLDYVKTGPLVGEIVRIANG